MKIKYIVTGECGICHYLYLTGKDEKEYLNLKRIKDDKMTFNFLVSKGMAENIDVWMEVGKC